VSGSLVQCPVDVGFLSVNKHCEFNSLMGGVTEVLICNRSISIISAEHLEEVCPSSADVFDSFLKQCFQVFQAGILT
jgi:hypothetical protein